MEDLPEFYRNKSVQGEEYTSPDQKPAEPVTDVSFTTDHGETDHHWLDKGIQVTGERVVRCRDCALGMELTDTSIPIVDGRILWPIE